MSKQQIKTKISETTKQDILNLVDSDDYELVKSINPLNWKDMTLFVNISIGEKVNGIVINGLMKHVIYVIYLNINIQKENLQNENHVVDQIHTKVNADEQENDLNDE